MLNQAESGVCPWAPSSTPSTPSTTFLGKAAQGCVQICMGNMDLSAIISSTDIILLLPSLLLAKTLYRQFLVSVVVAIRRALYRHLGCRSFLLVD